VGRPASRSPNSPGVHLRGTNFGGTHDHLRVCPWDFRVSRVIGEDPPPVPTPDETLATRPSLGRIQPLAYDKSSGFSFAVRRLRFTSSTPTPPCLIRGYVNHVCGRFIYTDNHTLHRTFILKASGAKAGLRLFRRVRLRGPVLLFISSCMYSTQ